MNGSMDARGMDETKGSVGREMGKVCVPDS